MSSIAQTVGNSGFSFFLVVANRWSKVKKADPQLQSKTRAAGRSSKAWTSRSDHKDFSSDFTNRGVHSMYYLRPVPGHAGRVFRDITSAPDQAACSVSATLFHIQTFDSTAAACRD